MTKNSTELVQNTTSPLFLSKLYHSPKYHTNVARACFEAVGAASRWFSGCGGTLPNGACGRPQVATLHDPRRPTASQPNVPDGCRNTFQRCCGEREVKKLNLLRSPVFWCLGDGPTMHEPGALPKTPGRRVTALPMTDHLVTRPGADAQPQRPLPQALVLACRRVCWALSDRHRAGGRTRKCVLKITRCTANPTRFLILIFI